MKHLLTFSLLVLFSVTILTAQQESDFYTETLFGHTINKHLKDDYKLAGSTTLRLQTRRSLLNYSDK